MRSKRSISRLQVKKQIAGWIFVLPFIIGLCAYFLPVVINSLIYSFSNIEVGDQGMVTTWAGLKNFEYAIKSDTKFVQYLTTSVSTLLANTPSILIFSLFIAVILNQKMRGRAVFRAIFFIPVIIATGMIERADLNNAVLNNLAAATDIESGALASANQMFSLDDITGLLSSLNFSVTLTSYVSSAVNNILDIVNQSGIQILIFLAGLQSISPSIYESAEIEGATAWECFWKITFPMISPMILVNLFYTIIDFFTKSSSTMMEYVHSIGFDKALFGEASAMSWIYFVSIAAILLVVGGIVSRFVFYQQRD
ncbi:MAG: carbohydrate ABC transporter permease [Acutalibacteraceae bacterium]|jgi:ABC-type sugar transport system permease subunit